MISAVIILLCFNIVAYADVLEPRFYSHDAYITKDEYTFKYKNKTITLHENDIIRITGEFTDENHHTFYEFRYGIYKGTIPSNYAEMIEYPAGFLLGVLIAVVVALPTGFVIIVIYRIKIMKNKKINESINNNQIQEEQK